MDEANELIQRLGVLERRLRTLLLNRTVTLTLRNGAQLTGRVVWVEGGIEILTDRGIRSISFLDVLEVRSTAA